MSKKVKNSESAQLLANGGFTRLNDVMWGLTYQVIAKHLHQGEHLWLTYVVEEKSSNKKVRIRRAEYVDDPGLFDAVIGRIRSLNSDIAFAGINFYAVPDGYEEDVMSALKEEHAQRRSAENTKKKARG